MAIILDQAQALAESETIDYPELQLFPFYSVDKISDTFGDLYRVWVKRRLVGTFYQRLADDKWVSQPINSCYSPNSGQS